MVGNVQNSVVVIIKVFRSILTPISIVVVAQRRHPTDRTEVTRVVKVQHTIIVNVIIFVVMTAIAIVVAPALRGKHDAGTA